MKPDGTLLVMQKNACKIQRKAQRERIVSKNHPAEFLNLLISSFVGELFSFHVTAYYQMILTESLFMERDTDGGSVKSK